MPTTPLYALPYPGLSDTADVPRDIQALADKIDGLLQPKVVTALPGSPVDGQEVYYQADATNGIYWHLRYRAASSSAYKWEFVGGARLRSYVLTGNAWTSPAAFAWQDAPGGPTITFPLAGEYEVDFNGTAVITSPTAVTDFRMRVGTLGNIPAGGGGHAQNTLINPKGSVIFTAIAGQTLPLQVSSVTLTCAFQLWDRTVWARPVRVS